MAQQSSDLPNFNSLGERANDVYKALGDAFIDENRGKYIAIETSSGEYFVGGTRDEAVLKAKQKYPTKLIFVRKIGALENLSRHLTPAPK